MATLYPGAIQTFPTMQDVSAADAPFVKQYQDAMQVGDLATAQAALSSMTASAAKRITADFLNTMSDTCIAIQREYLKRYNPSIIVSATQPSTQNNGDYWWQVI